MALQPPWRKALWCQQQFPDNYTDDKFLESLIINADVVQRSYRRVVWASLAVDQQLCIAAIVASVAYHLHQGTLLSQTVFIWEACMLLAGATLLFALSPRNGQSLFHCLFSNAASPAALLLLTGAVSPIYANLTASISPDTIVACAAALLIAHLYLNDYNRPPTQGLGGSSGSGSRLLGVVPGHSGPSLKGSLGLSCAMCASILMASQLHNLQDVFALMVLSLEVYILAPPLHYILAERAPAMHAASLAASILIAMHLLTAASVVLTSALEELAAAERQEALLVQYLQREALKEWLDLPETQIKWPRSAISRDGRLLTVNRMTEAERHEVRLGRFLTKQRQGRKALLRGETDSKKLHGMTWERLAVLDDELPGWDEEKNREWSDNVDALKGWREVPGNEDRWPRSVISNNGRVLTMNEMTEADRHEAQLGQFLNSQKYFRKAFC